VAISRSVIVRRLTNFWLSSFITAIVAAGFAGKTSASNADRSADPGLSLQPVMRLAFNASGHRLSSDSLGRAEQAASAEARKAAQLRTAAENGDARAQFDLGICYENGRGVAKDAAEAVNWFQRAAEQGCGEAQYALGCCYHGEDGFPKNQGNAVKWWAKAAAQGFADAQYCLGLSYFMGEGVDRNPAEAAKWWKSAAAQDHADAEYFLGLSYAAGLGVPKTEERAAYWLGKAATAGNQNAVAALKKIGRVTTPKSRNDPDPFGPLPPSSH
jgi:TPR repeat protein